MPQIAVTPRFTKAIQRQDTAMQKAVWALLEQFWADSRAPSLDLEPYEGSRDPKFRTMRLSRGMRVLAWALDEALFVLDDVATHEEAKRAARNRTFSVNARSGTIVIANIPVA